MSKISLLSPGTEIARWAVLPRWAVFGKFPLHSTEVNLEVVEVLMFLAGSYSEIWGCLFYSVNMLNRNRKLIESP